MIPDLNFGWTSTVGEVVLGATRTEGGTRSRTYRIGGGTTLPFIEKDTLSPSPLIAFEICDDSRSWSPIVNEFCGDLVHDPGAWAKAAETTYGADLVRLCLTSTRQRDFSDIPTLGKTVETVLASTTLPLIIEGSNEPKIDSEVFQKCGETGQGERLLLGTAEAGGTGVLQPLPLRIITRSSPSHLLTSTSQSSSISSSRRSVSRKITLSSTLIPARSGTGSSTHIRRWNGSGSPRSREMWISRCR